MSSLLSFNYTSTLSEIEEYYKTIDITKIEEEGNNYKLGLYYQFINKNYELMKEYYNKAIIKDNCYDAFNNLGYHYMEIEKDYKKALTYYNLAIENNNFNAYNNIGLYYYNIEKKYEEAVYYFLLACDNNIYEAYNNIGLYYIEIQNNYDTAKLYFIEAYKNGLKDAYENLKNITSDLERYILSQKYNFLFIDEKTHNINIFINRINKYGIKEECQICLQTYIVIPLECTHSLCIDCYPKIIQTGKCPFCRIEIMS